MRDSPEISAVTGGKIPDFNIEVTGLFREVAVTEVDGNTEHLSGPVELLPGDVIQLEAEGIEAEIEVLGDLKDDTLAARTKKQLRCEDKGLQRKLPPRSISYWEVVAEDSAVDLRKGLRIIRSEQDVKHSGQPEFVDVAWSKARVVRGSEKQQATAKHALDSIIEREERNRISAELLEQRRNERKEFKKRLANDHEFAKAYRLAKNSHIMGRLGELILGLLPGEVHDGLRIYASRIIQIYSNLEHFEAPSSSGSESITEET